MIEKKRTAMSALIFFSFVIFSNAQTAKSKNLINRSLQRAQNTTRALLAKGKRTRKAKAIKMRQRFKARFGPWALVTGASSGIGEQIAYQLAEKGLDTVLLSRTQQNLEAVAQKIKTRYPGRKVKIIAMDLSQSGAAQKLDHTTQELDVGLLVSNAGSCIQGEFLGQQADSAKTAQVLRINVNAHLELAKAFGDRISKRDKSGGIRGGVLITSSPGSNWPVARVGAYPASKSFLNIFAQSHWYEFKQKGIVLRALQPGLTDTTIIDGMKVTAWIPKAFRSSPKTVAKESLESLEKQRKFFLPFGDSPAIVTPQLHWRATHSIAGRLANSLVPREYTSAIADMFTHAVEKATGQFPRK